MALSNVSQIEFYKKVIIATEAFMKEIMVAYEVIIHTGFDLL